MDIKEKLVELLKHTEINKINGHTVLAEVCFTPNVFENMANNLITHGVTVQERNGCEYCKGEFIGENPIVAFGDDSDIESIVEGEFLYNFCNCGAEHVVKINFCPMCGRRISDE